MAKVPAEVVIEQYGLRASFFANQLTRHSYFKLYDQATALLKAMQGNLDWRIHGDLGIDDLILARTKEWGFELGMLYCHPAVIIANPVLLKYYRGISAFSQKGLTAVSGVSGIDGIEQGRPCTGDRALRIAMAVNRNLNLIYHAIGATEEHRKGLLFATAGASIDGSWRNAIGSEGERIVKSILLRFLLTRQELSAVVTRSGEVLDVKGSNDEWVEERTQDLQTAICTNGGQLKFGSEPDLTCIRPDGSTSAGIEVKAGLDPAGALERLGAMLKSFEHVLAQEPNAETILIASCITPEVQKRLNNTRSVSRTFILTEVINDRGGQGKVFCNMVRGCLGLVDKRL
ncbi:MAG: XcyI family restriction endonuclease [Flavobacteriales bacterium]|nr:XcyI family restriction endonuclease [Flavobacteriales bacterium]